MLGAAVLIGVIVWMARAAGRRSAADAWRSKVIDAYAKGSASRWPAAVHWAPVSSRNAAMADSMVG